MSVDPHSDLARDYAVLTSGAGLIDRSARGKLALSGAEAATFLHGQVSQDITALAPGQGAYAALLTNKGKMIADLRVLNTGDELLLDTERPALQELFNTLRRFLVGYDVELHKRTLQTALLSLIGPASAAVLERASAGLELRLGPVEHDHVMVDIAGVPVRIVRGDAGIDLLLGAEPDCVAAVSSALEGAGARPVGERATECVRVESGRPRYGVDLDDGVIPQEAGLNERAVSFTKGCYVGQETVARLFYRGKPNRQLQGLRASEPLMPGTELRYEDRVVATVTSAVESPRFGPIGLAFVRRETPVGASLSSGDGTSVDIVALPFT